MKFGRRAFLQFAAGAVGGTLLSPLPWQLMDDSAIWSQNWSWRPSPEDGHITKVPSICTLCDGGCGIQARLVDGKRAILVEGNPAHPINQGGVCPLCASALQLLYAPYRIAQPMKQTRKRGDIQGFQPVSWDEALKELSNRLAKLRSDGKSHSVACITGQRRNSMDDLWQQFLSAYGSPNFFKMPSQTESLRLASLYTTGRDAPPAFSLENASYVLSFGAPLIEGWGAPGWMQAVYRHWHEAAPGKRSVKVVQVESRCSLTASKADQWVPIAPGAEAALALGIAHVMVKDNLFDQEFVKNHVFGFEDWTDANGKTRKGFKSFVLSAENSPEEVARLTGVDAATTRALAKEFAGQENAVAVWGGAQGELPNNLYHDLAFIALNALKGNMRSGGMVTLTSTPPLGTLPTVQLDDLAQQGLQQKRVDLARAQGTPLPGGGVYAFLDALDSEGTYPIELLMVHEANPAHNLPENRIFETLPGKVRTLVSFSSYMDETALQSDLILPNHMAFERYEDVMGLTGVPYGYYAVAAPILPPRLDTRHTGDVVLQVGKALGGNVTGALPWKSYDVYLQERVKGLAAARKGMLAEKPGTEPWKMQAGDLIEANYKDGADLWKRLMKGACWIDTPADMLQSVASPSGRIELASQVMLANGLAVEDDKLYGAHYAPPALSGSEKEYPLLLVSMPNRLVTNQYLPTPPFMIKALPATVLSGNDSFVELHPKTAQTLGLEEGDRAVLRTLQGEATVRVHLSPASRPGVLYILQGLGHKGYDEYIQNKGINANNLVEVQMDPVTGLGTFWASRAQLRRA